MAYTPTRKESHMAKSSSRNPWIQGHMDGEMDFTGEGYTRRHARALVLGEYEGHEDPETCGNCGADAWYRATVGTYQCPNCRAIEYPVWVDRETGQERRGSSM